MKRTLLITAIFLPLLLSGQNDIQLSQQFLSRVNYNPAATGASNYVNAFLIARQQWIGFREAPSTQVLNAHSYFNQINSGMGLSVTNDRVGAAESSINAKFAYAYYLHFEESYLAFGLGAGILYKNVNIDKLRPESGRPETDPTLSAYINDRSNKVNPDFDFGVEFNMVNIQVGASVTHLHKSPLKIKNFESGRHFYLYGKYTYQIDENWKVAPSLIGQLSAWPIMQIDLNAIATYKERFWFGASFRSSESVIAESVVGILGLYITDFLGLGYSYDFNPGPLKKYSSGSHEISLRLRISKGDDGGGKTPRFFE